MVQKALNCAFILGLGYCFFLPGARGTGKNLVIFIFAFGNKNNKKQQKKQKQHARSACCQNNTCEMYVAQSNKMQHINYLVIRCFKSEASLEI